MATDFDEETPEEKRALDIAAKRAAEKEKAKRQNEKQTKR